LDAAIGIAAANVREFPQQEPHLRAGQLYELGSLWSIRHQLAGAGEAIDNGIDATRQALQAAPGDWDQRASCLSSLGDLLMVRYQLGGSDDDLDQAVTAYAECADATRGAIGKKSENASAVQGRAIALRERFNRRADPSDLDQAIRSMEPIVADPELEAEAGAALATTLGGLLRLRYELLGRTSDLQRAIRANTGAIVPGQKQPSETQATALNNLGVAMLTRYRRLNEHGDLASAIEFLERGIAASAVESSIRWERIHNLASAVLERYLWTRQPDDADYALRVLNDAQAVTPEQSLQADREQAWRAIIIADRSQVTGQTGLSEQACRIGEHALGALPPGEYVRPRLISGLARALLAHHDHEGSGEKKLERAIELCEFALSAPRAHWSYLPAQCADLAYALQARYAARGDCSDLDQTVSLYREISQHLDNGDLRARLAAACTWTRWAVRRNAWQEACDAALGVRDAATRLALVWMQTDPGPQWWSSAITAVPDACGIMPHSIAEEQARNALEQARTVLGEQARAEAKAMLDLHAGGTHHREAPRVREAVDRLRILDHSSLDRGPGMLHPRQRAAALARAWDELRAGFAAASWPQTALLENLTQSLRTSE
jgi:hypothetical protein